MPIDPGSSLLSSFNCTGILEQLVLRQLVRATDGRRPFGSVHFQLLPRDWPSTWNQTILSAKKVLLALESSPPISSFLEKT